MSDSSGTSDDDTMLISSVDYHGGVTIRIWCRKTSRTLHEYKLTPADCLHQAGIMITGARIKSQNSSP